MSLIVTEQVVAAKVVGDVEVLVTVVVKILPGTGEAETAVILVQANLLGDVGESPVTIISQQDVAASVIGIVIGQRSARLPRPDTPGFSDWQLWGSAHITGFHMALCDGSVRAVSYDINRKAHQRLGNREDGEPLPR